MYGIHTALLLFVLIANIAILVITVGTVMIIVGIFSTWVWRMRPPVPPWKRYHIGLNHVNTKVSKIHQMNLNTQVPVAYRTIG